MRTCKVSELYSQNACFSRYQTSYHKAASSIMSCQSHNGMSVHVCQISREMAVSREIAYSSISAHGANKAISNVFSRRIRKSKDSER